MNKLNPIHKFILSFAFIHLFFTHYLSILLYILTSLFIPFNCTFLGDVNINCQPNLRHKFLFRTITLQDELKLYMTDFNIYVIGFKLYAIGVDINLHYMFHFIIYVYIFKAYIIII